MYPKRNTHSVCVLCPIAHDYLPNKLQHLTFLFICPQCLMRQANSPTRVKFVWLGKKILQTNSLILTKLSTYISHLFLQTAIFTTEPYTNLSTQFEHNSAEGLRNFIRLLNGHKEWTTSKHTRTQDI